MIGTHFLQHNQVAAAYDRAASNWTTRIERLGYPKAYRTLLSEVAPQRPLRVLDAGCGTGDMSQALLDVRTRPSRLDLLDPSDSMLRYAQKRLAGRTQAHMTGLETFGTDARYDLILAAHVIEHCNNPAAACARLVHLLEPGGQLVLVISRPHWCNWLIWLRWRHKWFAPSAVLGWLGPGARSIPLASGPPARTSLAYIFDKPQTGKDPSC